MLTKTRCIDMPLCLSLYLSPMTDWKLSNKHKVRTQHQHQHQRKHRHQHQLTRTHPCSLCSFISSISSFFSEYPCTTVGRKCKPIYDHRVNNKVFWPILVMQAMSTSTTTNTNYFPPQHHGASPPITFVLSVLLLFFFFVGFFSIYFCKCFMDHILTSFGPSPSGDLVGTAVVPKEGLDVLLIQSFPTFKYASVKDYQIEKYGLECAICLVEFDDDSMLRLLTACCHVFHQECIDLWLESHKTCPFCRGNLESVKLSFAEKSPVLAHENNAMQDIHGGNESVLTLFDPDAVHIDIKDEDGQDHQRSSTSDLSPPNNNKHNNNNMAAQDHQQSSSTNHDHDQESHRKKVENETERFSRSRSTWHSIVRPREEEDRYTLRLPEHVKIKLLRGHHNWTGSCTTFGEFSHQRENEAGGHFGEVFGSASAGGDVNKL